MSARSDRQRRGVGLLEGPVPAQDRQRLRSRRPAVAPAFSFFVGSSRWTPEPIIEGSFFVSRYARRYVGLVLLPPHFS
jgi:hypothetical protein